MRNGLGMTRGGQAAFASLLALTLLLTDHPWYALLVASVLIVLAAVTW